MPYFCSERRRASLELHEAYSMQHVNDITQTNALLLLRKEEGLCLNFLKHASSQRYWTPPFLTMLYLHLPSFEQTKHLGGPLGVAAGAVVELDEPLCQDGRHGQGGVV